MTSMKNIVKGVLAFFIGVLFSAVSYWIVPILIDILAEGLMRTIFYGGLVLLWIFAIIVRPIMIIMKNDEPVTA